MVAYCHMLPKSIPVIATPFYWEWVSFFISSLSVFRFQTDLTCCQLSAYRLLLMVVTSCLLQLVSLMKSRHCVLLNEKKETASFFEYPVVVSFFLHRRAKYIHSNIIYKYVFSSLLLYLKRSLNSLILHGANQPIALPNPTSTSIPVIFISKNHYEMYHFVQ